MFETKELEKMAGRIRATCVKMAFNAGETHVSSALSCVDILTVLFGGFLNYCDGGKSCKLERDRFIMSKGHGCSALYATMAAFSIIPREVLKEYAQTDSLLPNHPCKYALPHLEISSGSLGHGLGIAGGILYGLRLDQNLTSRAVVLMSDGECNEGSVWEASMFAAAQKLTNVLAIVDCNGSQAVGRSDALMGFTSLEEKFRSFGWEAISVNGNNISVLVDALNKFPFSPEKPSVIIANTVSGAGVSFMEKDQVWFYRSPSKHDLDRALVEIEEEPFY
ncbi:transketolase [Thermodesulfobacteriota bacterium]